MMKRYQNQYLEDMEATTMAEADELQPNEMTADQVIRTYTSRLSDLVLKTEHRRCADHFALRQEEQALASNKKLYDQAQAYLQRMREEDHARAESETASERKERRSAYADLREEATTIASVQINRANETIHRCEKGLCEDRAHLHNIRGILEQTEILVEKRVKDENYFIRILRIYCRLQFLQDIRNSKPRHHVLPPKQTSPAQNHTRVLLQIKQHHQKQLIREAAVAAASQATIRIRKRIPKSTKESCD